MQCACAVPPCVLCCAALGNRLARSLDGLSAPASVPLQGTLSPFNDARVAAGFAILSCVEWYLTHDDGQLHDIGSMQKSAVLSTDSKTFCLGFYCLQRKKQKILSTLIRLVGKPAPGKPTVRKSGQDAQYAQHAGNEDWLLVLELLAKGYVVKSSSHARYWREMNDFSSNLR